MEIYITDYNHSTYLCTTPEDITDFVIVTVLCTYLTMHVISYNLLLSRRVIYMQICDRTYENQPCECKLYFC